MKPCCTRDTLKSIFDFPVLFLSLPESFATKVLTSTALRTMFSISAPLGARAANISACYHSVSMALLSTVDALSVDLRRSPTAAT
jgi:hypothetical protein